MSHTIQLTAEQFEALQSGQPITIEPPKPAITKWEPVGGHYCVINYCLSAGYWDTASGGAIASGLSYKTQSQADSAAKAIRVYARQLAWLAENDDGWVADWNDSNQGKYFVYIEHSSNKIKQYRNYTDKSFGIIYMSESNATKLAQLMNDGIVEF